MVAILSRPQYVSNQQNFEKSFYNGLMLLIYALQYIVPMGTKKEHFS